MFWKIFDEYGFEVDKDGNEYPEKVDSLASALEKISSDGFLIVKYELQIEDRRTTECKIELPYEDVDQLNEQQILDLIRQEIKIKHNL